MTISLRHCVREAQHGNHEAVLFLLSEFEPLIRKYVKKYYMYYESLEEAISTADHAIVDCIFTFDLNKQDNPKADLTKATVDTAAKAIVDSKIFATTEGGNLTGLKSSQIVTRKVETLE